MQLGICVITYNIDIRIFLLQIGAIRKFCKDSYHITVVDNSTNDHNARQILHHCRELGLDHKKTNSAHGPGTESHAFSANLSYQKWMNGHDYLLYIDHDCIPVKPFSIVDLLKNRKIGGLAHMGQKKYFWAGLVFWNDQEVDRNLINFMPSHEFQLDTGGMLYRMIEKYGEENCVYLPEEYVQNPHAEFSMYNFYSMIGGIFMHFINSSNWNNQERNDERLNSLINIANERINDI